MEIVGVFKDGAISGGATSRTGLDGIFKLIQKSLHTNPITLMLTDELDRVARDTEIYSEVKLKTKKMGVKLINGKITFTDDSIGKYIERSVANTAQFQREHGLERTVRYFNARLREGFRTRFAPVGYKYVRSPGEGKILVRNEPSASIISDGLNAFASGRINSVTELTQRRKDA